jgi:hypothetical protein
MRTAPQASPALDCDLTTFATPCQIAAPTVPPERRVDLVLPPQFDQQT